MPRKQTFKLPPLNLGDESIGQRIAKLRKTKGLTQTDLVKKLTQGDSSEKDIHNIRALISDYETNRIRPHYEMVIRLSMALEVSADELLGIKLSKRNGKKPSLKIQRRLKKIEELPSSQQRALLQTIDNFLKGVEAGR